MFIIRAYTFASVLTLCIFISDTIAFEYLNPREKSFDFKGMLNDSIPIESGERVVMERQRVPAKWVVAVLSMPYDLAKTRVHDLVKESFGIRKAHEISASRSHFRSVDLHEPKEPLFGDGFSDFRAVQSGIRRTREYRIITNQYNRSEKYQGYSTSLWRIGDGNGLFGRPCAVLVIQRIDHSREWSRDHTGLPWPFKVSGDETLVTDTEIALLERLRSDDKAVKTAYFVPYPANKANSVLQIMREIAEATREK